MKILASTLMAALRHTAPIASKPTTMPILSCVHLQSNGDTLHAYASNLEITITMPLPVTAPGDINVCIEHRRLSGMLSAVDSTIELELTQKDQRLIISLPDGECQFSGANPEEMPALVKVNGTSFTLPSSTLRTVIDSVIRCAKDHAGNAMWGAVIFRAHHGQLVVWACEGRRAAIVRHHVEGADFPEDVCLPSKWAAVVSKSLPKDGDVTVTFSESWCSVDMGQSGVIHVKRLEGKPQDAPKLMNALKFDAGKVTLSKESFTQAINASRHVCNDRVFFVRLEFAENTLTISADNGVDKARSSLPVKFPGSYAASFNPLFLLDAIAPADSDDVTLELAEGVSQIKVSDSTGAYEAVAMGIVGNV